MLFSRSDRGYGFGRETTEVKCCLVISCQGPDCQSEFSVDIDLDHLAGAVFVRFLLVKLSPPSLVHTVPSGRQSLCTAHTKGVGVLLGLLEGRQIILSLTLPPLENASLQLLLQSSRHYLRTHRPVKHGA